MVTFLSLDGHAVQPTAPRDFIFVFCSANIPKCLHLYEREAKKWDRLSLFIIRVMLLQAILSIILFVYLLICMFDCAGSCYKDIFSSWSFKLKLTFRGLAHAHHLRAPGSPTCFTVDSLADHSPRHTALVVTTCDVNSHTQRFLISLACGSSLVTWLLVRSSHVSCIYRWALTKKPHCPLHKTAFQPLPEQCLNPAPTWMGLIPTWWWKLGKWFNLCDEYTL